MKQARVLTVVLCAACAGPPSSSDGTAVRRLLDGTTARDAGADRPEEEEEEDNPRGDGALEPDAGPGDDGGPPSALTFTKTLAQRQAEVIQRCVDNSSYDPTLKLVRVDGKYPIRAAVWLAYCDLRQHNAARARALLDKALGYQITAGADKGYWPFFHDEPLKDRNAIAFIVPTLGQIKGRSALWQQLDAALQVRLTSALAHARSAVLDMFASHVPVWYGNIYLALIDSLVALGELALADARALIYERFTEKYGINEYGAWNYDVVQLAALQNAYAHSSGHSALHARLGRLLEYHWDVTAHQLHRKTRLLTSSSSRAKAAPARNISISTLLYLYFEEGTPAALTSIPRIELLLSDYWPPARVRALWNHKLAHDVEWQARFGRVDAHVYVAPEYALATQSGRRSAFGIVNTSKTVLSNEDQEVGVRLTINNGSSYKGVAFRATDVDITKDDFNHHWVTAVQKRGLAVVSFNFDPRGQAAAKLYVQAILGRTTHLAAHDVRLNGTAWSGAARRLHTSDRLAFRLGRTNVGLRFLTTDVIAIPDPSGRPILLRTETLDGAEVITLTSFILDRAVATTLSSEKNKRLGFVIEVDDTLASLDAFVSARLDTITVHPQSTAGGTHIVKVDFGGRGTLELQERMDHNVIVSRKIDGQSYDNRFLLRTSRAELMPAVAVKAEPSVATSGGSYLPLEAEQLALSAPMKTRTSRPGSLGGVIYSPTAGAGLAGGPLNIPATGEWHVWVRVFWPSSGANAIDLRINTDNVGYPYARIESSTYGRFHWIKLPAPYYLHRGSHTVLLRGRAAYAEVDQLRITDDARYVPQG